MSDSGLTICIGDGCPEGDSDTYGESSTPHDTQAEATQGETLSGSSQHAANADSDWRAITSAPDFCWVGNSITGFDSIATLDNPVRYSPNVIAAGCELYRVNDLFQGIQGDAGQHVISGTSLGSGHVLITGGQDNVKANGLPMARHDSPCTINCNAAGVGGTPGYLMTEPQDVESSQGQSGEGGPGYNPGEEGRRVINDKWEGAKSAAKTFWEMLPYTGDEVTTGAARDRAWQDAKDTYEAVDVLTGPSPLDLIDSGIGWLQGDAERAGQFGEEWKRTGEAYGGIKDSMVNAWQEAEERNGTWGAMEMSVVVLIGELAGGKGTGVLRGATKIPDLETPPPPNKGVHVSTHVDINPDKKIGGRKIINSDLAGTTVTTRGGDVRFDNDGFPDFTPYSQKTVRVEGLTGSMTNDVPLAMERAGIMDYDQTRYVWHHHQDGRTMMLVPKDVHSVRNGGIAHTGGRAVIQHNLNNPSSQLNYPSPDELF